MAMINAEAFSKAGAKYLGTPYTTMDCQKFYERCLADCGLKMDLTGSNAWYRKFRETGWVGSPEECKAKFGSIPRGATMFIHAFDGGEVKRGYHDGLGNASHIGIKTGTGKGAIHSSSTAECVAESNFQDKTIRNGGWNCVGLSTLFDYGDKTNRILTGGGSAEDPGEGDTMEKLETWAASGVTVNMRRAAKMSAKMVEQIPIGESVEVIETDGNWKKCRWGNYVGWIRADFLIKPENPAQTDPSDLITVNLTMTRDEAADLQDFLEFVTGEGYLVIEALRDAIKAERERG